MATTIKKDRSDDRVVSGACIALVAVGIIALPWPLAFVGLVTVASVAGSELSKLGWPVGHNGFRWNKLCYNLEWTLLGLWPVLLTYIDYQSGRSALTLVVFGIFVSDVAAYYGGRQFGRHKLAVSISPGKSYEGVFCGLAGGLLVAAVVWNVANIWPEAAFPQPLGVTLVLMAAMVLCGVAGDLNESYLKRLANIKDSGTVLRGHGGMLDRLDSMFSAAILAALFAALGWL